MQQLKILISGGGTGGHIFPAIAIARALEQMKPGTEILFVGALGRMEMDLVPKAGYRIEGLDISGISRKKLYKNFSLPVKLLRSISKSKQIIARFQPNVVVGVGGYASGPALWAAVRKKIPALIQEQNSYPGITNRILAKYVDKICVAYTGMEQYFPAKKIVVTGNPVRQEIADLKNKRKEALDYFQLKENGFTMLVVGGSLGAGTINKSISKSLESLAQHNIGLIWQTGKGYYARAQEEAKKFRAVKVYDFISRMDYAYAAADAVVSRAGAITLSELCAAGLPSILVPSPNVAEDHQTKNAMKIAGCKGALVISDDKAEAEVGNAILKLAGDVSIRKELGKNIASLAVKDPAARIAKEVIELSGIK